MTKVKTIEFWLVVLPVVFILAVLAAGFDKITSMDGLLPWLAMTWAVLATFWMLRELFRRLGG